jgi:zinc transport system permease protein
MVISMQFNKGFKLTIIIGVIISVINVLLGLSISYFQNLPSGSTIVVVSGIMFIIVYLIQSLIKGKTYV